MGPSEVSSGEQYTKMRNSERHEEEVWKHGYCTVLPKISHGDPLNIIKAILQLHIIEEENVQISPELEKERCLRVSLKSHPFGILTSCHS